MDYDQLSSNVYESLLVKEVSGTTIASLIVVIASWIVVIASWIVVIASLIVVCASFNPTLLLLTERFHLPLLHC